MKLCPGIIMTANICAYLLCANTGLSASQGESHSVLLTDLLGRRRCPHFTDMGTEAR